MPKKQQQKLTNSDILKSDIYLENKQIYEQQFGFCKIEGNYYRVFDEKITLFTESQINTFFKNIFIFKYLVL